MLSCQLITIWLDLAPVSGKYLFFLTCCSSLLIFQSHHCMLTWKSTTTGLGADTSWLASHHTEQVKVLIETNIFINFTLSTLTIAIVFTQKHWFYFHWFFFSTARDADEREKWIKSLENTILRHTHFAKVSKFGYYFLIFSLNKLILIYFFKISK